MNCKEFKSEFVGKAILAFVASQFTHIYKFDSDIITFFMRRFVDEAVPAWHTIFFYSIKSKNVKLTREEKLHKFEQKADFLNLKAKRDDQIGNQCVFRRTFITPDTSLLEGKKAKVTTISQKYFRDSFE